MHHIIDSYLTASSWTGNMIWLSLFLYSLLMMTGIANSMREKKKKKTDIPIRHGGAGSWKDTWGGFQGGRGYK